MAFCVNCGQPLAENATFCEHCGAPVNQVVPVPYIDPSDHTADFDAADISENKVYAMAAYLLGIPGIVIALLAGGASKYASFHCRQALKLEVLKTLIILLSAVLCWTILVPIVGGVCAVILFVIQVICFFQVCSGKAKDAPIVSSLGFLK